MMYIKEIYLKSFGKFIDKRISFDKNINLIYGHNEAGKTTIHTFIKGILYGIKKTKKRNELDVYTRYLPWDNNNSYEGSMLIEVEGVDYRITRGFLAKADFVEVMELNSGKIIDLKDREVGDVLLNMSEASFANALYIGQLSSKTGESLGVDIKTYLTNMTSTGNQEIDLARVYDYLDKQTKGFNIKTVQKKITDLEEQLQDIEKKDMERQAVLFNVAEKEKEFQLLKEKQTELELKFSLLKQKNCYEKLERVKKCKTNIAEKGAEQRALEKYKSMDLQQLEQYGQLLSEKNILSQDLDDLTQKCELKKTDETGIMTQINYARLDWLQELEGYSKGVERQELELRNAVAEIDLQAKLKKEKTEKHVKLAAFGLLAVAVILLILGFTKIINSLLGVLAGAACIVAGVIIYRMKAKLQERVNDSFSEQRNVFVGELMTISIVKPMVAQLEDDRKEIALLQERINERQHNIDRLNKNIAKLIENTGITKEEDIFKLKQGVLAYEKICLEIATEEKLLQERLQEETEEALEQKCKGYIEGMADSLEVNELQAEERQYKQRLEEIGSSINRMRGELEQLDKCEGERMEIEELLSDEKDMLAKLSTKQEAFLLARSTIEQVAQNISGSFGNQLDKMVSNIVANITGHKYTEIRIGTEAYPKIDTGYKNYEIDRFSTGTIDQIYLAVRAGVAELLYKDKELPMLFDDSLVMYDEARRDNTLDWLNTLSNQVLLFTCHSGEYTYLSNKGVNVKHIILE